MADITGESGVTEFAGFVIPRLDTVREIRHELIGLGIQHDDLRGKLFAEIGRIIDSLHEDDAPMPLRAAWSSVRFDTVRDVGISDPIEEARRRYEILDAANTALNTPGELFAFEFGDFEAENGAYFNYTLRRTAGTGLEITELYNKSRNWLFHRASVEEVAPVQGLTRFFRSAHAGKPVIRGTDVGDLTARIITPDDLIDLTVHRYRGERGRAYLLGSGAVRELLTGILESPSPSVILDAIKGHLQSFEIYAESVQT